MSGFKVFASAPLLYTDATIDPSDKCVLKVVIKTTDKSNCSNLVSIGDVEPNILSTGKWPTLLPAPPVKGIFQLSIGFQYEQACSLAAEYIESRRLVQWLI